MLRSPVCCSDTTCLWSTAVIFCTNVSQDPHGQMGYNTALRGLLHIELAKQLESAIRVYVL